MKKRSLLLFKAICITALLINASWGYAQELTVSAAGSLSSAFKEIGAAFEAQNPGVTVTLNFAAAGVLLRQMEQGAPVDVFASADQEMMDRAVEKSLVVPHSRTDFAQNTLVLVIPHGSHNVPAQLSDLTRDVYTHIGVGRPGITPAGNYIHQLLVDADLWDILEGKFVFAEHVTQVVQYVATKEADVGFVFITDATKNAQSMDIAFPVSEPTAFVYPIAQAANSGQPELAAKFIEFVTGEQGREIMDRHGFALPAPNP